MIPQSPLLSFSSPHPARPNPSLSHRNNTRQTQPSTANRNPTGSRRIQPTPATDTNIQLPTNLLVQHPTPTARSSTEAPCLPSLPGSSQAPPVSPRPWPVQTQSDDDEAIMTSHSPLRPQLPKRYVKTRKRCKNSTYPTCSPTGKRD